MSVTTLLAVVIAALAIIAFTGGILIASVDERKIARSGFRRFVTHPVTVASSAALAAGCLAGIVVVGALTLTSNVTASPSIPKLTASYSGSLRNTTVNTSADMSLTAVKQSGGKLTGHFQVGSPLVGSGDFTGTVDTHRNVKFTVPSSSGGSTFEIDFSGTIAANGGMSGTYVVHYQDGSSDQQGTWTVTPSAT